MATVTTSVRSCIAADGTVTVSRLFSQPKRHTHTHTRNTHATQHSHEPKHFIPQSPCMFTTICSGLWPNLCLAVVREIRKHTPMWPLLQPLQRFAHENKCLDVAHGSCDSVCLIAVRERELFVHSSRIPVLATHTNQPSLFICLHAQRK
jgi:hypothetical protein